MEIERFKKKNKNEYTIYFKNNSNINLYEETIINFNIIGKKKINKEELDKIILYNQKYEAYYKALKDLTSKLRTEKELRIKLEKNNYTQNNIDYAINKLKEQGYLNKELYLKSFIADQIHLTLNGPNKIIYNLEKLGFEKTEIDSYMDLLNNNLWLEKINNIIIKKEKLNNNLSISLLKNKIYRDLLVLGYNQELIDQAINEYEFKENPKILEKEIKKIKKRYQNKYNGEELKKVIKNKLYQKRFKLEDIDLDNY